MTAQNHMVMLHAFTTLEDDMPDYTDDLTKPHKWGVWVRKPDTDPNNWASLELYTKDFDERKEALAYANTLLNLFPGSELDEY